MDIDCTKCEYFKKFYETNPNGYGKTYENYCFLYKDKCDKYPQCIYRNKEYQQLKAENEKLRKENEELQQRLSCKCFNSKSNELRCTSYLRLAEDYERDLNTLQEQLKENEKLKGCISEIENNSEILHENHKLRIANAKLTEDLLQVETSMRSWRDDCNKFKQCLEEIKGIANAIVSGNHFTNDIEAHLKELAKKIINICEGL